MTSTREYLTKNLMLSAQGGAGYWADVDFPEGVDSDYLPLGSIFIRDVEGDNDKSATFTVDEYADIIDDFAKNATDSLGELSAFQNRFLSDWSKGNYDVADFDHATADLIAQWALFDGKIIYG